MKYSIKLLIYTVIFHHNISHFGSNKCLFLRNKWL